MHVLFLIPIEWIKCHVTAEHTRRVIHLSELPCRSCSNRSNCSSLCHYRNVDFLFVVIINTTWLTFQVNLTLSRQYNDPFQIESAIPLNVWRIQKASVLSGVDSKQQWWHSARGARWPLSQPWSPQRWRGWSGPRRTGCSSSRPPGPPSSGPSNKHRGEGAMRWFWSDQHNYL